MELERASQTEEPGFASELGEDLDGHHLLCAVRVEGGRVYVRFGDHQCLAKQIDVAQVLFDLSDTQARIVELIAEGLSRNDMADRLGVSANTIKTHIRRTFEKMAVTSQQELLRLLYSLTV